MLPQSEADWSALKEAVRRFEDAWRQKSHPKIDAFLPSGPALRSRVLTELVHIELELRLKAGENVRVEEYLVRYPELTATRPVVVELIAAERELRRHREAGLTADEYLQRFPEYRAEIVQQGWLTTGQGKQQAGRPVSAVLKARQSSGQRYVLEGEIARGGMGAVVRAVDCNIRRAVAIKYLLDQADSRKKARFVEEAQVTGQLEHPNIVPIHELALDAQQRLFFTMKLVKGYSLAQVFDDLRQGRRTMDKDWTLGRLLAVFVNVCHALAYAHSRGVIHRDLKPANIMLGNFGEVYVMDWGLAKVLSQEVPFWQSQPASAGQPPPGVSAGRAAAGADEWVQTDRDDGDRTEEGVVLGTPAYMPPEQARGKVADIDERGDVYSLGAILYEMLTLQPPVEKQGGRMKVLFRVMEGQILPPELRAPQRARAGQIPPELAAVAMKALAKEPAQRYATVDRLRRDIELFQEGRSVSAKSDTFREVGWKLVKRNKGVSAATAAALGVLAVVVGFFLIRNYQARLAAEKAQSEAEHALDKVRKSVPAFVDAARLWVDRKDFDRALSQLNLALESEPNHAAALLLKAQVLIVRQDFAGAAAELDRYLRQWPADAMARQLADICKRPFPDDGANLLLFAQLFMQQKATALADGVLSGHGASSFEARKELLKVFQQRIEAAWPGSATQLSLDDAGIYKLDLRGRREIVHLDVLEGMPLTSLDLYQCSQVRDLSPLQGMPLTNLVLTHCSLVQDLTPLQGMRLTRLQMAGCAQVKDLAPLRGMPLTYLDLTGCSVAHDLTLLQGMPLTHLQFGNCGWVQDLTALRGLALTSLSIGGTQVRDLTPLQGMPLTVLNLDCLYVRDLAPLEGMKLILITLREPGKLQNMDVLRQMKSLKTVGVYPERKNYDVGDFWQKYDAGEFSK